MMLERKKRNIILRMLFHAAKLPFFFILVGCLLIGLSYIDNLIPLTTRKYLFNISNLAGNVLIVMAILIFIYKLIVLMCWQYEKQLDGNHKIAALVLSNLRKGLRIIFLLIAINLLITLLGPSTFYIVLANNTIKTIIIGSIGWIVIQIFYTFEALLYQQMIRLTREENIRLKALYTKMHIIRNIATVVIIIVTVAAILMSFASVRNIGISLLASAGFLTALAGLAAQKTLFSIFSGLQIALSQTIKMGDTVVIENTMGTIEEITFTYVRLKLYDCRRLILPIQYFLEKPFQNWSQAGNTFKDTLTIHLDFMMPIEPLRTELDAILESSPHWDQITKKLQVTDIGDHSIEVSIQVSAATPDQLSDLKAEIREKLLTFIRTHYADYFPKIYSPNL